jgi:hypothetical protein
MDFDGAGCVDSVTGDTCSVTGADADYASGAAPLDGSTYSLEIGQFGFANSTTVDYMDAATLDFLMNIDAFGTNSSYFETIGLADGNTYKCGLVLKSNVGRFHIGLIGNEGTEWYPALDTTYRVRIEYDSSAGTCDLCADNISTAWGTCGEVEEGVTGVSDDDVNAWKIGPSYLSAGIFDAIGVCDEVGMGSTKCGDSIPTGTPTATPTSTPTATPTPTPTPEPGVVLQFVSGVVGMAWLQRRRNRRIRVRSRS